MGLDELLEGFSDMNNESFIFEKRFESLIFDKLLNFSALDYYSRIKIVPRLYLSNVKDFRERYIVRVDFADYPIGTSIYSLDYNRKKLYWIGFYPYGLLNEEETRKIKKRYNYIGTITHFLILDYVIYDLLNSYDENIYQWYSKHFWEFVTEERKKHIKSIIYDFEESYLTNKNILGRSFYEIVNSSSDENKPFIKNGEAGRVGFRKDEKGEKKLLFKEIPLVLEYRFVRNYLISKDIDVDKLHTRLDFFVLELLNQNLFY